MRIVFLLMLLLNNVLIENVLIETFALTQNTISATNCLKYLLMFTLFVIV